MREAACHARHAAAVAATGAARRHARYAREQLFRQAAARRRRRRQKALFAVSVRLQKKRLLGAGKAGQKDCFAFCPSACPAWQQFYVPF